MSTVSLVDVAEAGAVYGHIARGPLDRHLACRAAWPGAPEAALRCVQAASPAGQLGAVVRKVARPGVARVVMGKSGGLALGKFD